MVFDEKSAVDERVLRQNKGGHLISVLQGALRQVKTDKHNSLETKSP